MKLIAAFLLLVSCSLPKVQDIQLSESFYEHDLEFRLRIDGQRFGRSHFGTAVLPPGSEYEFDFYNSARIDYFIFSTTDRNIPIERRRRRVSYDYVPGQREKYSDIKVHAYEKDRGRFGFAFLSIDSPEYDLKYQLECEGEMSPKRGVQICQSQIGLFQYVHSESDIDYASERICESWDKTCLKLPKKCIYFERLSETVWRYQMEYGRCRVIFLTKNGRNRTGKLTAIGWQKPIIRGL